VLQPLQSGVDLGQLGEDGALDALNLAFLAFDLLFFFAHLANDDGRRRR
jgi:hypothetical protein